MSSLQPHRDQSLDSGHSHHAVREHHDYYLVVYCSPLEYTVFCAAEEIHKVYTANCPQLPFFVGAEIVVKKLCCVLLHWHIPL